MAILVSKHIKALTHSKEMDEKMKLPINTGRWRDSLFGCADSCRVA